MANHPHMVLADYEGGSGKMEQVLDAFETLVSEGHKVLIFSSFVTHLKLLADAFTEREWLYAMLTGSTLDRESEITRFSTRNDVSAFFISLKAGGVGLNLTDADYVFILDPWWNPAAELQAESRAHRIGQEKQVFVYRFITADTIEEKIAQCTSLIATLSRIREELETQLDDNATVRGKILDLMGVPAPASVVLDDKSTLTDGTDDADTAVEE